MAVAPAEATVDRTIAGHGTGEAAWRSCPALLAAPACNVAAMAASHPTIHIVSPHPDDEILGVGGLMAQLGTLGASISIVAVTDGGASHPGSSRWTVDRLERIRPRETLRALRRLGLDVSVRSLRIRDGDVTRHADVLVDDLSTHCARGDLVIAPWRLDGHPDHEACGRAAAEAATVKQASFAEYPVWAWHWAQPDEPSLPWPNVRRVLLDHATLLKKQAAIREFTTQLEDDGPRPPILPAHVLKRFTRPFEVLFFQ